MKKVLFLIVCLLILCQHMYAQSAFGPDLDFHLFEFYRVNGSSWKIQISPEQDRVVSILGQSTIAYGTDSLEAAKTFLMQNTDLFGIKQDLSDLRLLKVKKSLGGSHVTFQQYYNGIPIENAFIKINFNVKGAVLQVINTYAPYIDTISDVGYSIEQAKTTAKKHFLSITPGDDEYDVKKDIDRKQDIELKEDITVEKVVFIKDSTGIMAYKVRIYATQPFGLKEIIVHGQTGDILLVKDFVEYSENGTGRVFNPNPVCATNDNTLRDDNDADTAVPAGAYTDVILFDLDDAVSGDYRLSGPFARSLEIESPTVTLVTESTPDFNYDRSEDGFEEVMCYYHIDRNQRYIQTLGFIDVNNRQIEFDAHGMSGSDNAHYVDTPAGAGYIGMGDGGSDNGEDADIIMHEYGHSIQYNIGGHFFAHSGQTGAIKEGFCDYWACSSYFAESLASGWDPTCVAEWRQVNNDGNDCLRSVGTGNVYPDDYNGSKYHDSAIWSGTLWDIFLAIGKTTADRLILQSHFNMGDAPDFKNGADAMMTADLQLYYGAHLNTLCTIFRNRGIYGEEDCPDIPGSTGDQNTLVMLLRFAEPALPDTPVSYTDVQDTVDMLNDYLADVSFGQVSLDADIIGWYDLPDDRAYYYNETANNLLIELVQDGIDAVLAVDAAFDFEQYDRLLIITNDDGSGGEARGEQEWTTTGPWPYDIPAALGSKRLSASVHTFNHTDAQYTHTMGHHFGMFNLYEHEGVTFPRDYANGWGNMAKTIDSTGFINCHFLTWSKLKSTWLENDDILFIPRPSPDPDPDNHYVNIIPLHYAETDTADIEIIQIGTTNGILDRDDEAVSYYIEAREQAGDYDSNIPSSGVILYYLNESISQGYGPLRIVDATPGDDDLTNAAMQIGDRLENIDGTGITVEVLAPTGGEAYRILIDYDPPEEAVDVWIHPHGGNWQSVDIWTDSPACNDGVCGYDIAEGRTETDRGDKPRPGETNYLYTRIYNAGPGIAHNVRVDFWISDPYHGIDGGDTDPDTGGNVAFNKHYFTVIPTVPPTDEGIPVYVEWVPDPVLAGQSSPHACVKVKIAEVIHDINSYNQVSQENIHSYDTSSASPYIPLVNPFVVTNPYDNPILVYLRADNVPPGWITDVIPEKIYLMPGNSVNATITIYPPEDYLVCTTEYITVSAWYPAGDTLVQLGGTTAMVNLKKSVKIDATSQLEPCGKQVLYSEAAMAAPKNECIQIHTQGCTDPPRPNEHITLVYTGPDGEPVYHDIVTDEYGCFEDFYVNPEGGIWTVDVEYQGSICHYALEDPTIVVIVPPAVPRPSGRFAYSFHLGMNFPLGDFFDLYDAGPDITLDLKFALTDIMNIMILFGYHYFHGKELSDLYFYNVSGNIKVEVPFFSWKYFLEAGAGYYYPNYGLNNMCVNAGMGFLFTLDPRFKFDVCAEYFMLDPAGDQNQFLDLRMGVHFRF